MLTNILGSLADVARLAISWLVVLLSIGGLAHAASLKDDFLTFPNQSNDSNDTWQYFSSIDPTNRNGSYALLPVFDKPFVVANLEAWAVGNDQIPFAAKDLSNGNVAVHPQFTNNAVAAGYLVPATGLYNLSGSIVDGDTGGGNGIEWFLDRNAGNVLANQLDFGSYNNGGSDTFSLNAVPLIGGDMVYLIVGPKNSDANFDSTVLDFVINPVPEPSTFLLGGLGLLGLFFAARRKP